jgi:hypothetical protein
VQPPAAPQPSAEELLWQGKEVQITSEAAGSMVFGKAGKVNAVEGSKATLMLGQSLQVHSCDLSFLTLLSDLKPYTKFKSMVNLSRCVKQGMLQASHILSSAAGSYEEHDDFLDGLEVVTEKQEELLQQHITMAMEFIEFFLPGEFKLFCCVDPFFSGQHHHILKQIREGNLEEKEKAVDIQLKMELYFKTVFCKKAKKVCVPIFSSEPCHHWTLLVLELGDSQDLQACRYYDSLNNLHPGCKSSAEGFLQLVCAEQVLPARTNHCRQSGADCGLWTIHYLESEYRASLGEGFASAGWPKENVKVWQLRLHSLTKSLKQELDKLESEKQVLQAKEEKSKAAALKKKGGKEAAAAAAATAAALKNIAEQALQAGEDITVLSEEVQLKLISVKGKVGVCSKCKYSSGCYECDYLKAKRYYLRKHAEKQALEQLQNAAEQK